MRGNHRIANFRFLCQNGNDNAYFAKLWAEIPQPRTPLPPRLQAKSKDEVANLRREISIYLKKQSGQRSVERVPIEIGVPANFWNCQQEYQQFREPKKFNKPALYYLIARHLYLAEALFRQESSEVRESGMGVILMTIWCSADDLQDGQLAAGIADAYLVPHLEFASNQPWFILNRLGLLEGATKAYSKAERWNELELVCGEAIRLIPENRNQSDSWRVTLAKAIKNQRRFDDAINVLRDIHDPGLVALRDFYIPKYEMERDKFLSTKTQDSSR